MWSVICIYPQFDNFKHNEQSTWNQVNIEKKKEYNEQGLTSMSNGKQLAFEQRAID